MNIRGRAILVIVSTNFTIILLSILAGTGYVRKNIEKYIEADMMVVADIADRFISAELDLLRHEADTIAGSLAAADLENWNKILSEAALRHTKFIGMSIMSREAVVSASAGEMPATSDIFKNESVQRAFSGKKAFTSTVSSDDGVVFYLAAAIPGTSEHIMLLMLSGMYFSNLASEYHVWDTGHIFIDDRDGYVIANIRPEWVQNRQNLILQSQSNPQYAGAASVIQKLISGGRGIGYYSIGGISRICAYRPVSGSEDGWCLGIVAPLSESPVRDVDKGLILVAVVGFLLNIAAAVIASNFIKKPFEELAEFKEAAEADSRTKTSFLAHMSHEIRTPLNAVVGLSELTLGEEGLSKDAESNLEKISSAGSTILSIVNDILDISKIESGKLELNPIRYDIPSLINDTVNLNIVRIGEKPIIFKIEADENLPGLLYGDDLRVKQIFNNLLSNAFKYTNSGTVEWRIWFEREGDGIWLISDVRDTGIGIKREDICKLFSDYNQMDLKANRGVQGTGLGLVITKRLLEAMGGTITVESEYGKGSVFHVRLRQQFVSDKAIGKAVSDNLKNLSYTLSRRVRNKKHLMMDLSYASVLIVDDIATNLDVVKGMMKPYGLKIDCVTSGPQAVEMIRSCSPRYSAVFMDHMMPGMDGIEATRIIREEIGTDYAREIPIIALTANAIVGNKEMFLSCGFQAFISKPIDMGKLDVVLRQWVRDKSLERELEKSSANEGSAAGTVVTPLGSVVIEGVDLVRALRSFNYDEAVLMDVLRSYAANTRPLLSVLREYVEGEKLSDYAISVHGIKGATYGIFAGAAGAAAERLEAASASGDLVAVNANHPGFEKIVELLLNNIDKALAAIDASVDKPISAGPDPVLFSELREACGAFDMDRVDKAMELLESFRYESGGELVAWLRKQVNEMAFEKISDGKWPAE